MADLNISPYPGSAPHHGGRGAAAVERFEANQGGRDFVVGDIHGMFTHLEALLARIDFCPATDRLFSVGDLVDRGPHSMASLDWLTRPWFHACRGNHEQFALDSGDPEQLDLWVNYNGGQWWLDLTPPERERVRQAFGRLPLAMEVQTDSGLIGIVHADVPPRMSWEGFMTMLGNGSESALFYALWSRERIAATPVLPVTGAIDRIYCGHTPTRQTARVANVCYIDTGAVYSLDGYEDARLTMVQVQPGTHVEHEIRTGIEVPAARSEVGGALSVTGT